MSVSESPIRFVPEPLTQMMLDCLSRQDLESASVVSRAIHRSVLIADERNTPLHLREFIDFSIAYLENNNLDTIFTEPIKLLKATRANIRSKASAEIALDEMIQIFLHLHPEDCETKFNFGNIFNSYAQTNIVKAIDLYNVIADTDISGEALLQLSMVLGDWDNPNQAIELAQLIRESYSRSTAMEKIAKSFARLKEFGRAVDLLNDITDEEIRKSTDLFISSCVLAR